MNIPLKKKKKKKKLHARKIIFNAGLFSDADSEIFQTLHDYNLARGLGFHRRFDDLDTVSKLQLCQKYEMQIVLFRFLFRFLSAVV